MKRATKKQSKNKPLNGDVNGYQPIAPAVENVQIDDSVTKRKSKLYLSSPKLNRTTFRTTREMDFFSEKELITQTSHGVVEWPFVFVKELVDNSLDACEQAGIPPVVDVTADACGITVKDNGPGLP